MFALLLTLALHASPDAPVVVPDLKPLPAQPTYAKPRGVFTGEDWRYKPGEPAGKWFIHWWLRGFADLIAIPASIVRWDAGDYALFTANVGIPIAMGIPFAFPADGKLPAATRSLDSRWQDSIHTWTGGNCDFGAPQPCNTGGFRVFTKDTDLAIVGIVTAIAPVMLLVSSLTNKEPFIEVSALALEALAVAQVYHVTLKALTGRDGVFGNGGAGDYYGPTFKFFPAGTPSGHAASFFAVAGVYATYFKEPWLQVLILGAAGFLSAMLVIDDLHFTSDVLVGAAMGYLVGRWVVEHRSSVYTYGPGGLPVRLKGVGPVPVSGSGAALAATFSF
jgi:membrane-associated phospholipid phosphatase